MSEKYSEDSGNYRICWCGPEGDLVYTAWVITGKNKYGNKIYEAIGYFKTGSSDERKAAAKQACREHCELKKAG